MAEILHVVPKFVGLGSEEYQASFWLSVDPDPGLLDVPEVSINITDWLQDMYDTIVTLIKTTIVAVEYIVYIHDLITGLESYYFTGNWTFAGAASLEPTSPQIAPTISAPVIGRDRPGQKRMIPVQETMTNAGILTATAITALGNFATQWVAVRPPSVSFTYTPGIVSRAPLPRVFAPFTGTTFVRDTVGTVRSRKRGLGI